MHYASFVHALMVCIFRAGDMGKINLAALNEKIKKPTVGSSSTLGATEPEVASIVEALPLQVIAPEKVGPTAETEQEPRVATPRVNAPRLDDEDEFQAMMASLSQREFSGQVAVKSTGTERPVEEVAPPLRRPPKRKRREEERVGAETTLAVEAGGVSMPEVTAEGDKEIPQKSKRKRGEPLLREVEDPH